MEAPHKTTLRGRVMWRLRAAGFRWDLLYWLGECEIGLASELGLVTTFVEAHRSEGKLFLQP